MQKINSKIKTRTQRIPYRKIINSPKRSNQIKNREVTTLFDTNEYDERSSKSGV